MIMSLSNLTLLSSSSTNVPMPGMRSTQRATDVVSLPADDGVVALRAAGGAGSVAADGLAAALLRGLTAA